MITKIALNGAQVNPNSRIYSAFNNISQTQSTKRAGR